MLKKRVHYSIIPVLVSVIMVCCTGPMILPEPVEGASMLNVDETETSPVNLPSPIQVTWNSKKKMVVQVYKNGQLRYDKKHASGEAVIDIEPGQIEIKLWSGEPTPYKSLWVNIITPDGEPTPIPTQASQTEASNQTKASNQTEPSKPSTEINIDLVETPLKPQFISPFKVTWNSKKKMVVQVYKNGQLRYDKKHASGEAVIDIEPGQIEIKLWSGEPTPYKSVWVEIITSPIPSGKPPAEATPAPLPTSPPESGSELNIDETEQFSYHPLASPIQVTWNNKVKMVVQVYKDGRLIYDQPQFPGVVIKLDKPGDVEVKLWRPGSPTPYKSVWITITE